MARSSNRVSPVGGHKSKILTTLKPLAILCKCFGMLSIRNPFKSDVSSLKCEFFGIDLLLKFVWFAIYVSGYRFISRSVEYANPTSLTVTSAMILLSLSCHCTDSLFLDSLKFLDRYDQQCDMFYGEEDRKHPRGYIWVVGVLLNCVYAFFTCGDPSMDGCLVSFPQSILSVVINLPFILVFHLYLAISKEIITRFRRISVQLNADIRTLCLENCRILHAHVTLSAENLSRCFGVRFTLHFLILVYVTIWCIWAKCLLSETCAVGLDLLVVGYNALVLFLICYCSHKITTASQEVLEIFSLIPQQNLTQDNQNQIRLFRSQIQARPLAISACGMFDINLTTISAVFTVAVTHLIIVVQLSDRIKTFFLPNQK